MSVIEIKTIPPQTCRVYDPSGNLLKEDANQYEVWDLRVQIKEKCVSGYYCEFDMVGEDYISYTYQVHFDSDGRSDDWWPGIFDELENSMMKLL